MAKQKNGWVYCECGCHGSDLMIKGKSYLYHIIYFPNQEQGDYDTIKIVLSELSHGYVTLGTFTNMKEHDKFVREYMKKKLNELYETKDAIAEFLAK